MANKISANAKHAAAAIPHRFTQGSEPDARRASKGKAHAGESASAPPRMRPILSAVTSMMALSSPRPP
jgi:hypothetical protein